MNVSTKQNVFCLRVHNVLTNIGLEGHYTLLLDMRTENFELYLTKHGDFATLTSYVKEINTLRKAAAEEKEFFLDPRCRIMRRLQDKWNHPLDLENTFPGLREIYREDEALIDRVLEG